MSKKLIPEHKSKRNRLPLLAFEAIEGRPGWYRADRGCDSLNIVELSKLIELTKRLNESRPAHTYFVCGSLADDRGYILYRIETHNPLDVVRGFEVGSHQGSDDVVATVLEEMALVHAQNPIVPFFADSAGLKCTFDLALTEQFGEFLDTALTEGLEIMVEDAWENDEDGIGQGVRRTKCLELWWD
jgi:hypothetical protein